MTSPKKPKPRGVVDRFIGGESVYQIAPWRSATEIEAILRRALKKALGPERERIPSPHDCVHGQHWSHCGLRRALRARAKKGRVKR